MKREELKKLKIKFVEDCSEKESKILKKLIEKFHNTERYHSFNQPSEDDVMLAQKDHICLASSCQKTIKKGEFYFRRSFGQVWTIKACSIRCFCSLLP